MVLPKIISDTQGAFMKNCGTTSIAFASLELFHQIFNNTNTPTHTRNLAIKIDLSKAFDHIE